MSVLVLGLTRTDRYSVFAEWSLRTIFGCGSFIMRDVVIAPHCT